MKALRYLLVALSVWGLIPLLHAQTPQGISYQAVARNGGTILANQTLQVRFTILDGANPAYQETHTATTDDFGRFTLVIGTGNTSGVFSNINWSTGNKFLTVELNQPNGWVLMGTHRFQSVPYALYAQRAKTVDNISLALDDLTNVNAPNPASGEVLKWNGTAWVNAPDGGSGGTVNIFPGTGIAISNDSIYNTGDLNAADDLLIGASAAGDLDGAYPAPTVAAIQNRNVLDIQPTDGFVLKWDDVLQAWVPRPDATASAGATTNTTPRFVGDGSSTAPLDLAQQGASIGQVLKWNGSFWAPANDASNTYTLSLNGALLELLQNGSSVSSVNIGGALYVAGNGIDLSGNIITNTGDLNPNDDIIIGTTAGGDLTGLYPNPTVSRIRNTPVSATPPSVIGQVLKYNGSAWAPGVDNVNDADPDPTNEIQTLSLVPLTNSVGIALSNGGSQVNLVGGSGISISGSIISATGDLNPGDDVNDGDPAGGDLAGTYPNPSVKGIQGRTVSAQQPLNGDVYVWNSTTSQWVPASNNDADANPLNELQTLTLSGTTLLLSGGGGNVPLPYTGGTGISVSGTGVITNTGDTDPSNDLTTSSIAAGDVTGPFSSLKVERIQNQPLSNTIPAPNQVLMYIGGQWVPAAELDGSPLNEIQTLGLNNTTITLTNGGQVVLPYSSGAGINVNTTTGVITNTGDVNAGDDVLNTSLAGGDVSGVFSNLTVNRIQGRQVSTQLPATGQILKWNGIQWSPADDLFEDGDTESTNELQSLDISGTTITLSNGGGSVVLPYSAGPGISLTPSGVISNTGVLIGTPAGGDLSGAYPAPQVSGLQGSPVSSQQPTQVGQVLYWNGAQWIPGSNNDPDADPTNELQTLALSNTTITLSDGGSVVLPYNAGAGIDVNTATGQITNTGDTDGTDDITTSTTATGDVGGQFPDLTVNGLQGNPVSNLVPASGQVLKWNGTQWAPAADEDNDDADADPTNEIQVLSLSNTSISLSNGGGTIALPYTGGTGISVNATTGEIANTGDTNGSDDINIGSTAGGDLNGTYPNPTVDALQGFAVANTAPAAGQTLVWNGTQWTPATNNDPDADPSNEIQALSLSSTTISLSNGGGSVVLPYNAGPGIDVNTATGQISNTGDTDETDDITINDAASGDVSGFFPNLRVEALQGSPVANISPAADQVLTWNGTQWVPASNDDADADATNEIQALSLSSTTISLSNGGGSVVLPYSGGTGISVNTTTGVIANTGDTDASDDITTSTAAAGDVSGSFPNLTVDGIQGNPVANTAPANGQVLKWNGTQWAPAADEDNDDLDSDPTNEFQTIALSNTTITLSDGGGSVVLPYSGGTGISVNTTTGVIANTGDTNAADDITSGSAAGGDLNGTYPNPTVDAIQGFAVANTTPASGQVLRWNGTQWAPGTNNDADADATNEIQALSLSSTTISLSNGGGSVVLPYSGGTGISVNTTTGVIANTGDTDASDDITTSTAAAGDVSGSFPNLTVDGIQGNPVANTAPANGQVLKWNGTQWAPAADEDNDDLDSDPTNEFQTIALSNTTITLSDGGGSVVLPYSGGAGISVNTTTGVIANTGDTDGSDDVNIGSAAAGDLSGTYPNPTVDALQGFAVANTAPANGQVLRWNGTQWAPGTNNDADADATNEIQALSLSSTTISLSNGGGSVVLPYSGGTGISVNTTTGVIANTGDTDASDDITTSTAAAGDVSGSFPNLTVDGIQGNPVANTAPANGQVLKWNGTQWAPGTDDGVTYTGGTGIIVSGTTIINSGDTNAADDITSGSAAGGDLNGTYPNPTVDALQGNPVANTAPAANQVLKWNGTQWAPGTDDGVTYTGGTGISVSGTTIINTGDTDASDDITTSTAAAGDVSGSFPNLTVDGIQGNPVANTAPAANQVLKWNGTQWAPGTDDGVTYTGGTGIIVSGTTIINSGDTNSADDITSGSAAGGDLNGTYPNPTVDALQGNPVANTAPANGQVLRWNGTQWAPGTNNDADADATNEIQALSLSSTTISLSNGGGSVVLPYSGGTGISVNTTTGVIANTGDTDASDDITTSTAAAGDVSGSFPNLTVDGIQGNPVANTAPAANQVLKWNGTQWAPGTDDGATYTGGAGIIVSGTTIINSGDTNAADDITSGSAAGGDLNGTYPNPTVDALQGNPVANTAPANGQVLRWNGTQWAPGTNNDADADATNEIQALSLSSTTISLSNGGGSVVLPYSGGTGISVNTTTGVIANTGDTDASDDITTSTAAAGDVSGSFPNLTVDGIQGNPVANTAPAANQVLKWNGTQWAPGTDDGATYTGGAGIIVSGTTIINTGDTNAADDITSGSAAGGDLNGTYPNPTVDALQGNPVANTAPAANQVLKWNGTQWAPGTDDGVTYSGGTGISVSGTTIINTGDTDASDDITTSTAAAGDVSGSFPNLTVDGIQGNPVANTAPAANQVLKWNGTQWAPGTDDGATYTGGAGIIVSGTTIINSGDTNAADDITSGSAAGGDLNGTYPNPTVDAIQGFAVANTTPAAGEVLKWNGTQWAPAADEDNDDLDSDPTNELQTIALSNTTITLSDGGGSVVLPYSGGTGISVNTTTGVIANTGDTDASDDITTSTAAAGDVSGSFPNLTVDGIQGNPVANTAPASGQVLKWNGTQWAPAADEDNDDLDADPTNELQTIALSNTTITLSDGGGSVVLPYSGGTGISVNTTTGVIANTGDTDALDDITTSTAAAGDVSGSFPNLTVDGIQGNPVANTAPASGQVLKWNGTQWAPGTDNTDDADADPTNEIQSLSISGTTLSLSNGGGSVNIPVNTYTGGTGIAISGLTIINIGDTDAADDITIATNATGDVSGAFPDLTVEALQGNPVAASAPAAGEVLKWNGTEWAPAPDDDTDPDADPTNELQTLTLTGNFLSVSDGNTVLLPTTAPTYLEGDGIDILPGNIIFNTGDTVAGDDITIATSAGGDLSGLYPNPSVVQIQGSPVSAAVPATNDVLKWNGTAWTPAQDTDTDPLNEIQSLSLSGITLSLSNGGGSVNLPYIGGTGIALSGPTIINTGDTDASNDITNATSAGGDLGGTYPNPTVEGLQGFPVANLTPSSGQVLKWNGTQWAPGTDNDVDSDVTNELQTLSVSGTDLTLSSGGGTVSLLAYGAGTGISITGNTIANTGDTDASDDITTATAGAGDVTGAFPNLTVDGIQGNPVANLTPSANDVLKWNGTQWAPSADDINDADADPANELQTLSVSGTDLTLSSGGGTVSLLAYAAGTGIGITGNTIENTGDTDGSDDITTATAGAGDVSGTFPALTVDGLQGNPVAATAPAASEVLKWNGTEWAPAPDAVDDADADPANELQTLSVSGTDLTLSSGGGTVSLLAYAAGTGIGITGNTIENTGDTDGSDDITTATAGAGDVSGTFPALTVDGLQGNPVAATAPASGEVLKWDGTQWAPSADDINDADADPANELQTLSVSGTDLTLSSGGGTVSLLAYAAGTGIGITGNTIENTGDTDGSDDITTATAGAGDVSGTFPTLTVDGLQGNPVAAAAPASGDVLKWNGTQWAPSADDINDADADPANELQTLSVSGTDLTLSSGGGTVSLLAYAAGTGIGITGNTIENTGDTDGSDDITTATAGAGDVSGTFPTLTVDGLQGNPVAATAPASGDVLEWDGAQWTPGALSSSQVTVDSDWVPDADATRDLGTSALRWRDAYVANGVTTTSDRREKEQIRELPYGLDEIMQLNPVVFTWKDRPEEGDKLGLIAQEVLPVVTEAVKTHEIRKDSLGQVTRTELDRYGVNYSDLIPVLIKGMQEQQELIRRQQEQIQALQTRMNQLQEQQVLTAEAPTAEKR